MLTWDSGAAIPRQSVLSRSTSQHVGVDDIQLHFDIICMLSQSRIADALKSSWFLMDSVGLKSFLWFAWYGDEILCQQTDSPARKYLEILEGKRPPRGLTNRVRARRLKEEPKTEMIMTAIHNHRVLRVTLCYSSTELICSIYNRPIWKGSWQKAWSLC